MHLSKLTNYRTSKINLHISVIPYLTGFSKRKKALHLCKALILLVGKRSRVSNELRKDIEHTMKDHML